MQALIICQAAKASGVSTKLILHFEEVGLVPALAAPRSQSRSLPPRKNAARP